jgi:hypothetical protein
MSTDSPAQTTTLEPPAGLVVPNPQGTSTSNPPLFCLFTEDWIQLQTFIVQTLQLPITQGDFEAKYGTFTDEAQVTGCVSAMQAIQGLSTSFGDPTALVAQLASDPTILQTDTPPTALYTHIVWYATKLNQAATTFNQTLASFMEMLNPANCGDPAACLSVLQQLLTGSGGLQSTAQDQVTKANALVQALATFNGQLKPSIDTMDTFTAQSGTFYQDVQAAITTDITSVATFQAAADKAYSTWRSLTIAAVSSSVGVLILTAGLAWPVSAILGGVLGSEAQKARDAYNTALAQVASAEAEEQKKILLKVDLDAFNTQMKPTDQAADNFLKTLQQVLGIWTNISSNLAFISTNFTVGQITNLSSAMQALKLHEATEDWQDIATASQAYTQNSLVSYQVQSFGAPLPPT